MAIQKSHAWVCAFIAATLAYLLVNGQALAQAAQVPLGEQCFSALAPTSGGTGGTGTGYIGILGTITAGSGGVSGTYAGISLTGGSGNNATANITVSGGGVTAVAVINAGSGYVVGDTLSASSGNIGGVVGFSVPVSSVAINQALAGGSVGYYIPSTLTTKTTWQNASQATQNTNPITLDANGCALVYGIGTYRQIVKDVNGNIVWDQVTTPATVTPNPYWAGTAGGSANAITVTDTSFTGADGQSIQFLAANTNTGATTLNPSSFGAIAVVKNTSTGPAALTGNEIVAGNIVSVTYSFSDNEFFLQNAVATSAPPTSTSYAAPTNLALSASVASSALTVNLITNDTASAPSSADPVVIPFRNATITTGTWTNVTVNAATTFTVSSGNTLGTSNSVPFRLWVVAINNSGTADIGLYLASTTTSCQGFLEGQTQSTGSGTGGGNNAQTIYTSASSLSGVPVRIIGYMEWASGLATAGTWSSGPTTIKVFGPSDNQPCSVVQERYASATSVTITPTSAINLVTFSGSAQGVTATTCTNTYTRGAVTLTSGAIGSGTANFNGNFVISEYVDSPQTTSGTTYAQNQNNCSSFTHVNSTVKEIMGFLKTIKEKLFGAASFRSAVHTG